MLEICLKLGVHCVTAYAFSIENFKRSPEEVDALMGLAEEKLLEICQQGWVSLCLPAVLLTPALLRRELLDKYGVRLNILGKKELLPPGVRARGQQAEDMTRHNKRWIPTQPIHML